MNDQRVTLLLLLDLSAAFDTVDHDASLHRLQFSFGIKGKVLSWFESYLSGRSQQIAVNETLSEEFGLECGVPQGSCLGPLLFTLYFQANSWRSSNIIFQRFIVTLMTRRYTSLSARMTCLANLLLESYWKVALLTFALGCSMTILN